MTHEVETRLIAFTGEHRPIWENLPGTVELPSAVDEREALELSGCDWLAEEREVFYPNADGEMVAFPGRKALVRSTDDAPLGIVGGLPGGKEGYKVFDNHQLFAFASAVVGTGEAVYRSAGSLRGGKRIFAVLGLPESYKIGDDQIARNLLVASSHDGSLAFSATVTDVDVECANTLRFAIKGSNNVFKLRHTANLESRVALARDALKLSDGYGRLLQQKAEELIATPFSDSDWFALLDSIELTKLEGKEGKALTRAENVREELSCIRGGVQGAGNAPQHIKNAWGPILTFTEYQDHYATRRATAASSAAESRFDSVAFAKDTLAQQAFALLTA